MSHFSLGETSLKANRRRGTKDREEMGIDKKASLSDGARPPFRLKRKVER